MLLTDRLQPSEGGCVRSRATDDQRLDRDVDGRGFGRGVGLGDGEGEDARSGVHRRG